MKRSYSFIIPVYNRPDEVRELLDSFVQVTFKDRFEIVIIEDGSTNDAKDVIAKYQSSLNISYYFKPNTGPGDSRNYGMRLAQGNYFIILDSDVLMKPEYLTTVDAFLEKHYVDCYGGADAAHKSFTPLQKAINYVMTSLYTTGGIRGNKKAVQQFEPRSFNMGISKAAFLKTNGFSRIHPGEDPDLSQRIKKAGYSTAFIPDAEVFHKRRISWSAFKKQVYKFGKVRPILNLWHPEAAKITFWFPLLFIFFTTVSIISSYIYNPLLIMPLMSYVLIIFIDASLKNKSILIGALAVKAMFFQFFYYGIGFLKATYYIRWRGKNPETQFPELFFTKP